MLSVLVLSEQVVSIMLVALLVFRFLLLLLVLPSVVMVLVLPGFGSVQFKGRFL